LGPGESPVIARDQFYLSVPRQEFPGIRLAPDGGLERDYKYGRLPGQLDREDTKNVPLTPAVLPPASARLLRERLTAVWSRLGSD